MIFRTWYSFNIKKQRGEMEKKKFLLFTFWPFCVLSIVLLSQFSCKNIETGLPKEVRSYLEQNAEPIPAGYDLPGQDILSLDLNETKSELFLIGEMHGSVLNYRLFFTLLQSLLKSGRRVHILCESGHANSLLINHYLRTGEELDLIYLLNALTGSVAANDEQHQFLQQIRILNQELPSTEKLFFWGIDLEHQLDIAMYGIHLLLPTDTDHIPPPGLATLDELLTPMINSRFDVSHYPSGQGIEVKSFFRTLNADMSERPNEYQVYLGNNYAEISKIVDGAVTGMDWYDNGENDLREEFMYNRFLSLREEMPDHLSLIGLFGMDHVYKYSAKQTTLANMLHTRSDSPVKGMVTNVHLFYLDSFRLNRQTGDKIPIVTDFQDDLKDFHQGPVTLFSLNSDGSPFRNGCFLVFDEVKTGTHPTTDYFDLLGIVVNSPACRPWRVQ